jgi:hypothetical protein
MKHIFDQLWALIATHEGATIAVCAWIANSILTPLFRKIPPKNMLIAFRILVGIIDRIDPKNFARHKDNAANALKDAKAGLPASIATLKDQGDVVSNLKAAIETNEVTKS